MKEFLKAVQVSENVYWVGAIDWNVRNFHGYQTSNGSTYNAFLIVDEKVTLIDTVKDGFEDELLARISSVIEPEKIDYIVSNHAEPDHTGALAKIVDIVKPEKVFATMMGEKTLNLYHGGKLNIDVLKTGNSIDLGKNKLSVVETKMVHWPDSMVSYIDHDKVLFSQDAFGMHLAGSALFSDEYPRHLLEAEAQKYFANILMHLAPQVNATIEALPGLNLDIQLLAPDHGPLWRTQEEIGFIVDLYHQFGQQKMNDKAIVVYCSMWHSTEKLAKSLADGFRHNGTEVKLIDLAVADRSAIATEVLDSSVLCFGAPTMNNQMYPAMADVLTYLKGLRPKNKIGFAFGSFGWSGEGHKNINAELTAMKCELPQNFYACKYAPGVKELEEIFEIGVALSNELKAKIEA